MLKRAILTPILVFLAVAIGAPYLGADRFAAPIQSALERALKRKVRVGKVHYSLLTGPAFTVRDVVIEEDPSAGIEPFAYVTLLEARLRWLSMLTGRLEFSTLRLEEPSVNLVKNAAGVWNVRLLFETAIETPPAASLPDIEVRTGRLNFKFGDWKSPVYITNADVDVDASAGRFRFSGSPARTDRTAQAFGSLTARGRLIPDPAGNRVEINASLERSHIAELIPELAGTGIHGLVASNALISGRPNDLTIAGQLEFADVHGWDTEPLQEMSWPLAYTGRLDWVREQIDLTASARPGPAPLQARFRVSNFLSTPQWAFALEFRGVPLDPLTTLARHLGAEVPAGAAAQGTIDGAIAFSTHHALAGRLRISELAADIAPDLRVEIPAMDLAVTGNRIDLRPGIWTFPGDERAEIEATMESGVTSLRISTRSMSIARLQPALERFSAPLPPILDRVQRGTWRGSLRYQASPSESPSWTGSIEVASTELPLPELAEPLTIQAAAASIDARRLVVTRLRGQAGGLTFEGDYRYEPAARRPHRFRLAIPELDAADAARLLSPVLRREQGLLARALSLGRVQSIPEWLKTRRAEGIITAGVLRAGGFPLEGFQARLLWDGETADFTSIEAVLAGGEIRGRAGAFLGGRAARYHARGYAMDLQFQGGTIDAEFELETSGNTTDLLRNLRAGGSIEAHSVEVSRDERIDSLMACFHVRAQRGVPQLQLRSIDASIGGESYYGQADSLPGGRLQIELTGATGPLRLAGLLAPPEIAVVRP